MIATKKLRYLHIGLFFRVGLRRLPDVAPAIPQQCRNQGASNYHLYVSLFSVIAEQWRNTEGEDVRQLNRRKGFAASAGSIDLYVLKWCILNIHHCIKSTPQLFGRYMAYLCGDHKVHC